MAKVLSYADIRAARACKEALTVVPMWYPEGFPLTEEAVARLVTHELAWGVWLLEICAPAPASAEYEKATAPALAEYEKVRVAAWAEYMKATAPAWAEYMKATDTASAEYEKATAPAWAEYEKVRVAASAAALAAWGRGDYDADCSPNLPHQLTLTAVYLPSPAK